MIERKPQQVYNKYKIKLMLYNIHNNNNNIFVFTGTDGRTTSALQVYDPRLMDFSNALIYRNTIIFNKVQGAVH